MMIPFSFISCDSWLASTDFVNSLCLSMPAIVVVLSYQPINQDRHRADLGHRTILRPWNPSFCFTCGIRELLLVLFEASLTKNNGSSHSPSPNVSASFLLQLGCIMCLYSRYSHFSKLSSALRHFKHSLHVVSIWPFTEWSFLLSKTDEMRIWMKKENQKWLSFSWRSFLGVSQSDFVFRKSFIWMKTQKRDWSWVDNPYT